MGERERELSVEDVACSSLNKCSKTRKPRLVSQSDDVETSTRQKGAKNNQRYEERLFLNMEWVNKT